MSTAPVTLDFSKAQPIEQAAQPDQAQPTTDAGPVSLDFSKAEQVSPAAGPGPDQQHTAGDVADWSPVMRPEQMKNAASVAGGLAAIPAATASTVPAGAMAEELAGGMKILRDQATGQFAKAGPSLVGRIPGILKASYDWASANPLKAYLIYKIAEEAGVGTAGLKKVFHLVSGSPE